MPRDGTATPRLMAGSRGNLCTHPAPASTHPTTLSPAVAKNPKQAPLKSTLTPFPAINTAFGLRGQTLIWCTTDRNSTIYIHQGPPFCPALLEPGLAKGMEPQNKSLAGRQGTGREKAYGELYFRGQKSVTMWRRIASDNE